MDNRQNKNTKQFSVITSIGSRCFTEIFLKKLNYKKFSSPFDALYLRKVDDIIEIFENNIEYSSLLHTEDMENDEIISKLNKIHGKRSIYNKMIDYKINNSEHLYHGATFAHHNLKEHKNIEHFERCFDRLNKIKINKIKTLFCLFLFPFYGSKYSPYINISLQDIYKLEKYLISNYNCKLLVVSFTDKNFKILESNETLMYVNINDTSNPESSFEKNEILLNKIFEINNIKQENLLNYDYFI